MSLNMSMRLRRATKVLEEDEMKEAEVETKTTTVIKAEDDLY